MIGKLTAKFQSFSFIGDFFLLFKDEEHFYLTKDLIISKVSLFKKFMVLRVFWASL